LTVVLAWPGLAAACRLQFDLAVKCVDVMLVHQESSDIRLSRNEVRERLERKLSGAAPNWKPTLESNLDACIADVVGHFSDQAALQDAHPAGHQLPPATLPVAPPAAQQLPPGADTQGPAGMTGETDAQVSAGTTGETGAQGEPRAAGASGATVPTELLAADVFTTPSAGVCEKAEFAIVSGPYAGFYADATSADDDGNVAGDGGGNDPASVRYVSLDAEGNFCTPETDGRGVFSKLSGDQGWEFNGTAVSGNVHHVSKEKRDGDTEHLPPADGWPSQSSIAEQVAIVAFTIRYAEDERLNGTYGIDPEEVNDEEGTNVCVNVRI